MPAIDFEDLDDELKARIAPDRVDQAAPPVSAKKMSAGRKRKKTGDSFEAELDTFHSQMAMRGWGKIRHNHVPTKVIGVDSKKRARRITVGEADVDRAGWVRVLTGIGTASRPTSSPGSGRVVPVAFEAKVLGETVRDGYYIHDPALYHQLDRLRDAATAGEVAFLLVLDRALKRVFGVPIMPHYHSLRTAIGVQMYFHLGNELRTLVPSVERDLNLGWNWIPMIEALDVPDHSVASSAPPTSRI